MKKILMLVIGIILMTGCTTGKYNEVNYEGLMEKLNNNDTFVIVFGSSKCSACSSYEKVMSKVMKDTKVEVFYLDLYSLSDEDYAKIYSKFIINSTPTTVFIENGKETTSYDRIVGAAKYEAVIKKLEKYGYVGE